MDINPTTESALFRLAMQFVDESQGLDTGDTELQRQLIKCLESSGNCDIDNEESLHKLTDYIRLLAYPSHLSVDLLLRHDHVGRAIKITAALTNGLERKRALSALVDYFLTREVYEQALYHIQELAPEERLECIPKFVDACLDHNLLALLIALIRRLPDKNEQLEFYKYTALSLARRDQTQETLELLSKLKESSEYSSIQSNVTQILADHGHIDSAEQLAPTIADPGDREDAYNSILKVLLGTHHTEEAIAFTDAIPNTDEKIQAAKFIEKAMLSQHYLNKARNLREHFFLPRITYKRAA